MGAYEAWLTAGAVLAIVAAIGLTPCSEVPRGRLLATLALVVFAAVFGARALHVVLHPGADPFSFEAQGFSLDGAIFGVIPVILIWGGKERLQIADKLAIALGVGLVFARIGCWRNGCCFGAATDVPWAVSAPMEAFPETPISLFADVAPEVRVHPTQLYEILIVLAALGTAVYALRHLKLAGIAASVLLFVLELFRVWEFQMRTPDVNALIWPGWISLTLALFSLAFAWSLLTRGNSHEGNENVVDP